MSGLESRRCCRCQLGAFSERPKPICGFSDSKQAEPSHSSLHAPLQKPSGVRCPRSALRPRRMLAQLCCGRHGHAAMAALALLILAAPLGGSGAAGAASQVPPQCRLDDGTDPPLINVTFLGPARSVQAGEPALQQSEGGAGGMQRGICVRRLQGRRQHCVALVHWACTSG